MTGTSHGMTPVLAGRAVVITGAGRGLGAAYARAAAAAGAAVIVNDVDADEAVGVAEQIVAAGGRAIAHPADITDWDAAEGLIERCITEFGAIDGLVNNAGLMMMSLPQDQDPVSLRSMLDVNVYGSAACGTHALRHMVQQGSGAVVNVTSGTQMGSPALAVYGATKAAIATLTYSWADDVREHGVRVNAISPNAHTRMADESVRFRGEAGNQNIGLAPELNAPLVVYLLSALSADVTGQVVRLNGSELMLCTHPANLEPALTRDEWTVESIAEAFDADLNARLQPLGVVGARTETVH